MPSVDGCQMTESSKRGYFWDARQTREKQRYLDVIVDGSPTLIDAQIILGRYEVYGKT